MIRNNFFSKKSPTFKFGHYRPGKLDVKFTTFRCIPNYSRVQSFFVIFTVFYCKLHCIFVQFTEDNDSPPINHYKDSKWQFSMCSLTQKNHGWNCFWWRATFNWNRNHNFGFNKQQNISSLHILVTQKIPLWTKYIFLIFLEMLKRWKIFFKWIWSHEVKIANEMKTHFSHSLLNKVEYRIALLENSWSNI